MPRLLLVLPQLPHDPASGAARSIRTMGEWLAAAHWEVRALATTATESATPLPALEFLRGAGIAPQVRPPNRAVYRHDDAVLEFTDRGVAYSLLDTGQHPAFGGKDEPRPQFNRLFQRELTSFQPQIVLGFGGPPSDVERWQRAHAAGAKVVFGLRNHGYHEGTWLRSMDAILTPSQFLSDAYRASLNLASTALPPPLAFDDVAAPVREPIFFTAINPSPEKGIFFLARLAEELALRRPDLPMLFVESRGGASELVQAGLAGGFDLRRHESLMFAPGGAKPAELFRGARALLAPSVWEEPFGRVVAEALVNGVPPLVSDRGGLPEAAAGGGIILPLPASLTLATNRPVDAIEVGPWLEAVEQLASEDSYLVASERARAAGGIYQPDLLRPRYLEFFERVLVAEISGDRNIVARGCPHHA